MASEFDDLPQSPDRVMEEFLPLLGSAWEAKKALFSASDLEDHITNTLVVELIQRIRQVENISWSVRPQALILAENANGVGETIGRCDLIIDLGGNREYIQECKRLWPESKKQTFNKSARLYVQQGLLRFLQPSKKHPTTHPQYDAWLEFAGMIGYVMDGRIPEACIAVRESVANHAPAQEMTESCPAPCSAEGSLQFHSTHQDCTGKTIKAQHLFLGLPKKAPYKEKSTIPPTLF